MDETLVTVHISPYFLRLNFSNSLLEDDDSSAQYDPSSGYLTVTLTKETPGHEFLDLDLLAKLLAPRPAAREPVIEVISTPSRSESELEEEEEEELIAKTKGLSLEQEREIILKGKQINDMSLVQSWLMFFQPRKMTGPYPRKFQNLSRR